jgi:Flp pilus assembly protein TadD
MMTGAIGRLARLAALAAVAVLVAGCASQGQGVSTAPPGFGKDPASRVERLVQYCERLFEKGEHLTALGLCARAHEIDPDKPEPLMQAATILQAMNRTKAAVETYGILLERHPDHHEARYLLAKLHMESGETALAALHFERAIHSDPKDPRPYNALGILRDQAGEHETAQGLYRLALERDPGSFSVRNNLGLSLALGGKRAEAIQVLAELAVDPQAGETVLRNLEAAYAARPPQPGAAAAAEPPTADPAEAGEVPAAAASTMTAPDALGDAPEATAPTPLFVPPAAEATEPEQSGAWQSPTQSGDSAILAAAEQLMQPPEWAAFEPGVLIGAQQPDEAAAQPPPSAETIEEAGAPEPFLDDSRQAGAFGLSLLLLENGSLVA